MKTILITLVLALGLAAAGCDDDETPRVCKDYCNMLKDLDCMAGLSMDECKDLCTMYTDEGSCSAEYKASLECMIDGDVECHGGGALTVEGCDEEQAAYMDCAGTGQ